MEVLGFALRSGERLANRNAVGQSDGIGGAGLVAVDKA
ncbi:hypothetical protein MES5069_230215 [Mesorhizobium escarrei]|uniref:Uncharacterized protein n=1 Tax=Mesorhizobium escarrei TaxID=666018 RepID=A0ABM9DT63_9HYPH|nr:hypothetical protein MES5069_230215 [Mesorhizobium escarrei]